MSTDKKHDFFPAEAVDEWTRTRLSDYYLWDDVASLNVGQDVSAEVLAAFANLAKVLKLGVGTGRYGGSTLTIRRLKPMDELRKRAAEEMQLAYERGEIDENGHSQ